MKTGPRKPEELPQHPTIIRTSTFFSARNWGEATSGNEERRCFTGLQFLACNLVFLFGFWNTHSLAHHPHPKAFSFKHARRFEPDWMRVLDSTGVDGHPTTTPTLIASASCLSISLPSSVVWICVRSLYQDNFNYVSRHLLLWWSRLEAEFKYRVLEVGEGCIKMLKKECRK